MNRIKSLLAVILVSFLGVISAQAQDINTAIEAFNAGATAAQAENYTVAIEQLSSALTLAGAFGEEGASIVTDCKKLIPQLYYRQAALLAKAEKTEEALELIDKAEATATEYNDQSGLLEEVKTLRSQVLMISANEKLNAKDYDAAIEGYQKILELDANNAVAQLRLGMAAAASNKFEVAIKALEKARELGQEANAVRQLGNIYKKMAVAAQKTKNWNEVYNAATKAVELTKDIQSYKFLGLAAMELKKWQEAINAWEEVAKDDKAKDINSTYYRLATAHENLGDKGNACAYYKKLLSDPNFKQTAEHKIKNELKCE